MTETYPLTVVTVSIPSYEDHGGAYTLTLPDGSTAELTDTDDDYFALANIIDRAFPMPGDDEPEWRAATPAESEAWHAGWQLPEGMDLRETDHGLEVRQNTALTEGA